VRLAVVHVVAYPAAAARQREGGVALSGLDQDLEAIVGDALAGGSLGRRAGVQRARQAHLPELHDLRPVLRRAHGQGGGAHGHADEGVLAPWPVGTLERLGGDVEVSRAGGDGAESHAVRRRGLQAGRRPVRLERLVELAERLRRIPARRVGGGVGGRVGDGDAEVIERLVEGLRRHRAATGVERDMRLPRGAAAGEEAEGQDRNDALGHGPGTRAGGAPEWDGVPNRGVARARRACSGG
jgi:hypothetical protein